MNAKKIATSIPAEQYRALERLRRQLKLNRSEAVQRALTLWLSSQQKDGRVQEYVRAYLVHPEDAEEGHAYTEAWAAGQTLETWE